MTTKLVEAAKNTFGSGHLDGVFIGVEKIDNNGNMKYISTGLKTPISPWTEDFYKGEFVKNGMEKPYICYKPVGSFYFFDCDSSYKGWSVCEF